MAHQGDATTCHDTTACELVQIKYKGDGSTTNFDFPFTYIKQNDIFVSMWDEDAFKYIEYPRTDDEGNVQWAFTDGNATEITFTDAPPAPGADDTEQCNIKIYRTTDVRPIIARFASGSAIRARDLNDNFEQLQLAIEEGRCQVPDWLLDYLDKYFWNKGDETIYKDESFDCDADDRIASAAAICQKIENAIDDRIVTDPNELCPGSDDKIPSTGALCEAFVERPDLISRAQQTVGPKPTIADQRLGDDTIFSSAASAARHDTYHQDETPAYPNGYSEQPGKEWWDTDNLGDYIWDDNAEAWIDVGMAGPPGVAGPVGPPGVIHTGDIPPTTYFDPYLNGERPIRDGDAWWNTSTAHLYVYYSPDPGGSSQWVDTSVPGPKGNPGMPVTVHTGDEPPEDFPTNEGRDRPIQDGDLWFNTSNANLYVYYSPDPGGSSQWVDIAKPGPQGPAGADGPAGPEGPPGADGGGGGGGTTYTFSAPLRVDGANNVSIDLQLLTGTP